MSIHHAFQLAVEHHQAGRLSQAEAVCRQILQQEPNHPAALHFLGVIAIQVGRSEIAAELIRKAISLKPDYVEAHFNLAVALTALADNDAAITSYRQVIAHTPAHADAHYNLGVVLHGLGRLDEAVASYHQAIAHHPGFAQVHNNLGIALQNQGRLDEAVASFHTALSHSLGNAEAHYNLANALKEQGKLRDAITSYRRALEISPDFAEALDNLGVALHDDGKLDEAVACHRRALMLRPHWAETLGNLGMALQEQGKLDQALAVCLQALQIGETTEIKNAFVQCVSGISVFSEATRVRPLLIRAISEPWTRPGDLVAAALILIRLNHDFSESLDRATNGWPRRLVAQELFGERGISTIADDQLLQCLLENASIHGLELERFLTMVRHIMLDVAMDDEQHDENGNFVPAGTEDRFLAFYGALARQCFNNEYVFALTDEEHARARRLREQIIVAIASNAAVSELRLVTLAAYFPLTSVPGIANLLDQPWPAAVSALLTQQVREPLQEIELRTQVQCLTPVDGKVSRLVRNQYEENPYPRWIKCAPGGKARSLEAMLRQQYPHVSFKPLDKTDELDILVAGCGTGQHSIETAQQYQRARILAIDLSLSSICYAKRKTGEVGLDNIDYAQADITRMATVGRTFDVIESVGVLHHLEDPMSGWRILLSLLRPGGFMRLGLYSEHARQAVVAARKFIAERGYGASADEIRRCRQKLIASEEGSQFNTLFNFRDFFGTSECRDLLFHVQEHRYTLPELKQCIEELAVDFMGFVLEPGVIKQYGARFPEDLQKTDLDCWNAFETENPATFAGMYQFWVQKPA